jgi:hypothetical protein
MALRVALVCRGDITISTLTKTRPAHYMPSDIEGLIESIKSGASPAVIEIEKLELAEKYFEKGTKEYERVLKAIEKSLRESIESSTSQQAEATSLQFTDDEIARADHIRAKPDKVGLMLSDQTKLAYQTNLTFAALMVLWSGLTKINGKAWKRTSSLVSESMFLLGPPASGKTEFARRLTRVIDADEDEDYPSEKVIRVSSASSLSLLTHSGPDGKRFVGKVLFVEEITHLNRVLLDLLKMLATSGVCKHLSTGSDGKSAKRLATLYLLFGPLYAILTSADAKEKYDPQYLSRGFVVEFESSPSLRQRIFQSRFSSEPSLSRADTRLIERSWNQFFHELRPLDPSLPEAFADVDMVTNGLNEHLSKLGEKTVGDYDNRRLDILERLIASHVLVHQHQRKVVVNGEGRDVLVAEKADLNGVVDVFNKFVTAGASNRAPAATQAFRDLAPKLKAKGTMTVQAIMIALDKSESRVRQLLGSWDADGLIQNESRQGDKANYVLGPMWDAAQKHCPYDSNSHDYVARMIDRALDATAKNGGFMLTPMD